MCDPPGSFTPPAALTASAAPVGVFVEVFFSRLLLQVFPSVSSSLSLARRHIFPVLKRRVFVDSREAANVSDNFF